MLRYVDGCNICQQSKSTHHARYELMQLIPAAHAPWKRISTDFIVKLPNSKRYDSIMVVVDRNTKLGLFIPTNDTINSKKTVVAKICFKTWFSLFVCQDGCSL